MGITEDHSTLLWIRLHFLTGNSYVSVVKIWEEDPTEIPPFGSNQTEVLAGLNLLGRLIQRFPQLNNRLAHLPLLKKAFRNFTIPSIFVGLDYLRCESEHILATEKLRLGFTPFSDIQATISQYCSAPKPPLLPWKQKKKKLILRKRSDPITTETEVLSNRFTAILQRHIEPVILYKKWPTVNSRWVYWAFLRFNERSAIFKYRELLRNNATFEVRFIALNQFLRNLEKGRHQSTKKKCTV